MQLLTIDSPATVVEGESYLVRLTVNNQSTRAGLPCEAKLDVAVAASTAYTSLIPATRATEHFNAGEAIAFDYTMVMPMGSGGQSGQIIARVFDPAGNVIAEAIEDVEIVAVALAVEVTSITVSPTSLTDRVHEYNTHLGLGYWGDPFTISITFSNPFDYDVWVRPDYAFGQLTGEPLGYVAGTLKGFVTAKLLYFRLLLDSPYIQGDYSYTVDWQQLYHPQNHGSNMPQFVHDPDGIAVLAAGGDCWLKVPTMSQATTVKQAHLGVGISVALPDVFDLCVVANKAFYLYWDPHYRIVGGRKYLVNWKSAALDPCASAVPNAVSITPT